MPLEDKQIKENYNLFLKALKEEVNQTRVKASKITIEIKKYERLKKVLTKKDDINFLLEHKESVLKIARELEQQFLILNEFAKINNLSNPVALRIYHEILANEKLQNLDEYLANLNKQRDEYQEYLLKLYNIGSEAGYDLFVVKDLCVKYQSMGIDFKQVMYHIFMTTARKERSMVKKDARKVETLPEKEEILELEEPQVIDNSYLYKDEFKECKENYGKMITEYNSLLAKFYDIKQSITSEEAQELENSKSIPLEELISGEFNEAKARIVAYRLFLEKEAIDEYMSVINASDFSDLDAIKLLKETMSDFERNLSVAKKIETLIRKEEEEEKIEEEQKVFFFTLDNGYPFIDEDVFVSGGLTPFFDKVQAGFIQQNKSNNITSIKNINKEFKDKSGKTIFSIRNHRIAVSYLKLNSLTGEAADGGILVLSACSTKNSKIQEATISIINNYGNQIINKIQRIESMNPEELAMQRELKDKYLSKGISL